jgi:hypothetical protein
MPATDSRRHLTFVGIVVAATVACDGIEATEMPSEPPAVVAFDGPPCGDEIVVRPLDVDIRWRRESGLARAVFAETAAGAMLVLSEYSGAWLRLELDASPPRYLRTSVSATSRSGRAGPMQRRCGTARSSRSPWAISTRRGRS